MKNRLQWDRQLYRKKHNTKRFRFFNIIVEQSDIHIGVTPSLYSEEIKNTALNEIKKTRKLLGVYFKQFPDFLTALEPIQCIKNDPSEIKKMKKASLKASVGPMATVAGLTAEIVGKKLFSKYSPEEIVVENGGDIWLKVKESVAVEIFAGESPLSSKLKLKIPPEKTPLGICTSSATVGHSLSMGKADAAVISCSDISLADAFATSVCNMVKKPEDIEQAKNYIGQHKEILSAVIIIGDKIFVSGSFDILPVT